MKPRVYVDTSVVGGCLDDAFSKESTALLDLAKQGKIVLVVSELLTRELARAPTEVRELLEGLPPDAIEYVTVSEESERLAAEYVKAKAVGARQSDDAHHIALATLAGVDVILSWNFKHIVHLDRIRKFNAVNLREGYRIMEIRSPVEFV